MPIKFRCQHCKQFLGISRSKAGSVVDCPTCGRTVRVPQLDGKVKPLPKPKLNLEDSALASAMNELASLGEGSENETSDFVDSSLDGDQQQPLHTKTHSNVDLDIPEAPAFYHGKEQHADEELPVENESDVLVDKTKKTGFISNDTYSPPVQPQVIEMPPLATPEPIELAPAAKPNEYKDEVLFPKKQQPADSAPQEKAASSKKPLAEDFVSEEMASLAREQEQSELAVEDEVTFSQPAVPFQFPPQKKMGIAAVAGGVLVGLILGWFAAGLFDSNTTETKPKPNKNDQTIKKNQKQNGNQHPAVPVSGELAIRGRVTYKTDQQKNRPDKGSRVIVLPESRQGVANISHVGFRGGDSITDFKIAEATLHALGGDAAIVNEQGEYEVHLPAAGKYHIVIISHFQPRDDSIKVDVALRGLLRGYFDRPEQLLGKLAYHFDEVNFDGDQTEIKDFTFNHVE